MNFNIFFWGGGGFQTSEYFLGNKNILWIFFGVITNLDYIKGSFLCILGSFLMVKVQNWGSILGLVKFQVFFRVLEIPDIFWGG